MPQPGAPVPKLGIPITTFMIATDPLQEFVSDFTEANNGRAFFTA